MLYRKGFAFLSYYKAYFMALDGGYNDDDDDDDSGVWGAVGGGGGGFILIVFITFQLPFSCDSSH